MTFHCFFEQSGTFKKEFKKLGYKAFDYDILNDFGQTDYVVDLFHDIEVAYEREREKERTVFDNVKEGDQIIAFFPCIRFSNQIYMHFQGNMKSIKEWSDEKKLEYDIKLHTELHHLYVLISKLVVICLRRNIPLIIENPYSQEHYLTRYWAVKPLVIDLDRRDRGDYFKKPTQYWFFNRKPSNNLIIEDIRAEKTKRITAKVEDGGINNKAERSLISPVYAKRFIKEFII